MQQVWAGQQYVGGQQVMQLQLAAQQQHQASASSVQELYTNGYVDSAAVLGAASQKQMSSSRDRQTTDYRLVGSGISHKKNGFFFLCKIS